MPQLNPLLESLPQYSLLRNAKRRESILASGRKLFDYGLGDPKESVPAFIKDAMGRAVESVTHYPPAAGLPELKKACVDWLERRFHVQMPEDDIISANGSKESVFHIAQVLVGPTSQKKVIAYPTPGYPVYESSVILAGGRPHAVELKEEHGFVQQFQGIPENVVEQMAALWVCSPHNPTGAVFSRKQMAELYDWCLKRDIVLLSDECYVDMYAPGAEKPVSFLEVAKKNHFKNLLSFFSLSKRSGMTGYRTGFVCGDSQLVSAFAKYRPNAGLGTPRFIQAAAAVAWRDDVHVIERNAIFAEKRKRFLDFLAKNKVQCLDSHYTFYIWCKCPDKYESAEEFAQGLADKAGILVTPGDTLGTGSQMKRWFRIALVPSLAEIEESIRVWQQNIDKGEL